MDYKEMILRGNKRMLLGDLKLLDKTAREIRSQNIVEIGSMDGTSTLLLGQVAKDTLGQLYCYEPCPKARWKNNIKDAYLEDFVTLVMESSPWVNTKIIPKPLDYLLIDGKHETSYAITDYGFWNKFVRIGGRIAFHDFTGGKGVGKWVQRAVRIILEDNPGKLQEIGRYEARDRGLIVFEKVRD